jgi:branched-chain amino acid transport system permease protein
LKADLAAISAFAAAIVLLAFTLHSGSALNFVFMTLLAALMSASWNVLGGYGGQFSFGHALFFGFGAYAQALLQLKVGLNPWLALPLGMLLAAAVGAAVGWLSFRYGLRGSYFALVTLAFAEVCRIAAVSLGFTGGGVGLMVPLREATSNMQFGSRRGYVLVVLALLLIALVITAWLRHSRFGAWLQAVRDNEDAARAVGVDPLGVKLGAITISGALMAAAGALYVQVFQYIDPGIAFGPHTSVEALVGAIVGGIGTLWGPLLGALALHTLSELTRNLFGTLPGINLVIYGLVLIGIVTFMPRGLAGAWAAWRARRRAGGS